MVVAFNEQVPYGRIDVGAFRRGTLIFLESRWAERAGRDGARELPEAVADFEQRGFRCIEVPMEDECLKIVNDARRGKNMWVLGMLCCSLRARPGPGATARSESVSGARATTWSRANSKLVRAGHAWG